ncbi:PPE domain-containing protein [Mycobacterium haemophilum DSM 44634]|nr:PPE domain-containing protein [Mycobacterium haemophilum DSM 44634]
MSSEVFEPFHIDLQERLDVTRKEINSIRESYLTARAEMVSPQEIDKNRSRRRWLRATNAFGQNTAKIAALEAQYAQWVSPPPLTTAPGLAKPATRV